MTKARDLANASTALSAVSATELAFVDGVTSAIQTQMDAKAPSSTAVTLTGTQTLTNKTLTNPVIASVINNTLTSTTGDIIYASAANTPARLGIGTTGQVLNVASGVPAWATPAGGSKTYTLLSTVNSSAVTSLSFSSLSGKDSYLLTWSGVYYNSFGNDFKIRINNNSGSNYFYVRVGKDGNNPKGEATGLGFNISYTGSSSGVASNGTAFIEGGNGTGGKTINVNANVPDFVTGAGMVPIAVTGIVNLSATITSIDLIFTSTWSAGTFYLWGA